MAALRPQLLFLFEAILQGWQNKAVAQQRLVDDRTHNFEHLLRIRRGAGGPRARIAETRSAKHDGDFVCSAAGGMEQFVGVVCALVADLVVRSAEIC